MRTIWKVGLAAVLAGGGLGLAAAEAAPFAPAPAVAGEGPVTQAAYVCGPWGCRWRPGWGYGPPRPVYGYGYGPRPYYGRRCWWRPTPWGPRRVCRAW